MSQMSHLTSTLLLLFVVEIATGLAPDSVCFAGGSGAFARTMQVTAGSLGLSLHRSEFVTKRRCEGRRAGILSKTPETERSAGDFSLWARYRSRGSAILMSTIKVSSDVDKEEFTLRRARPHELDLLAILSTEAFTPQGEWYDVVQRVKFLLVRWDLQAQFYQRFYHWKDVVKDFDPPLSEARYALLAAAKPNGNAIGVTELCVAPNPASKEYSEEMNLRASAPYLSNLAVAAAFRRKGVGQGLVKWCEELSAEWGHKVLFLHVDVSNENAIQFYRNLGFVEAPRDMAWYDRIGRQDLQVEKQMLLVKTFEGANSLEPIADNIIADARNSDDAQIQLADSTKDALGPLS